ncbi:hypothetical protein L9F63_000890, partial [Diploptera punctata]
MGANPASPSTLTRICSIDIFRCTPLDPLLSQKNLPCWFCVGFGGLYKRSSAGPYQWRSCSSVIQNYLPRLPSSSPHPYSFKMCCRQILLVALVLIALYAASEARYLPTRSQDDRLDRLRELLRD